MTGSNALTSLVSLDDIREAENLIKDLETKEGNKNHE